MLLDPVSAVENIEFFSADQDVLIEGHRGDVFWTGTYTKDPFLIVFVFDHVRKEHQTFGKYCISISTNLYVVGLCIIRTRQTDKNRPMPGVEARRALFHTNNVFPDHEGSRCNVDKSYVDGIADLLLL